MPQIFRLLKKGKWEHVGFPVRRRPEERHHCHRPNPPLPPAEGRGVAGEVASRSSHLQIFAKVGLLRIFWSFYLSKLGCGVAQSGCGVAQSGCGVAQLRCGVAQKGAKWLKRVRRGSNSSASACRKAGPSSNLGSAPQKRPSTERKLWGKHERSTSYIFINILCMLRWCKNK